MVKVKALMSYNDHELKKWVTENDEPWDVTEERAEVLVRGNETNNYKPFVKILSEPKTIKTPILETAEQSVINVETADIKPKRKKVTKE